MSEEYTKPKLISPPMFNVVTYDGLGDYYSKPFIPYGECARCGEPVSVQWIQDGVVVDPCLKCALGDICDS